MSEEQLDPIAIDRLSGEPYGEDQSLTRCWTLADLREAAEAMGKPWNPPAENLTRLTTDLAEGAQVLFTEEEVLQAIAEGSIPTEWQEDLINLVVTNNDIAIIPQGAVEQWREQQKIRDMVIGRRRPGWPDGKCWWH